MVKFCLALAALLIINIAAYFPFKRVPENRVVIEFEEANLEQSGAPAVEGAGNKEGEEMEEKVEAGLEKREGVDPAGLI